MKTLRDFLECDLFNTYDYVEIRNYDDSVIIERMRIKDLWQHVHDTENYLAEEFKLMSIYCGGVFYDKSKEIYKAYMQLLVRFESEDK